MGACLLVINHTKKEIIRFKSSSAYAEELLLYMEYYISLLQDNKWSKDDKIITANPCCLDTNKWTYSTQDVENGLIDLFCDYDDGCSCGIAHPYKLIKEF